MTPRSGNRGFTMIEMAIVLLILGLLLGGGLAVLSTQVEMQKTKDTQRLLEEAREALMGFAVRNGRLPCPADPTLAAGAIGAGNEVGDTLAGCTGGAAGLQGVLPWATLGLPETDAWGRRFTYRVSAFYARTIPPAPPPPPVFGCATITDPTRSSFALCTPGDINVLSTIGGATLAGNVPAVIVSHGVNGWGAYLPSGAQMAVSADADELENSNVNTTLISKTPTTTYDDLMTWVTPNILANRMLQAGRLP